MHLKVFALRAVTLALFGATCVAAMGDTAGNDVLYDQTTTQYASNLVSTNWLFDDSHDSFAADDFIVTDSSGWRVRGFDFAMIFDAADPQTTYNVYVFPDDFGLPGSTPICQAEDVPGTFDAAEQILNLVLPGDCVLGAGRYWIAPQSNIDDSVSVQQMYWMGWKPPTMPGFEAEWKNPGNGYGLGYCFDWTPTTSCGSHTNPMTAFGFRVRGLRGGGTGCSATGLCLHATASLIDPAIPTACGTHTELDVEVGDEVHYCYILTNNTGITLDYQTLTDRVDGTILGLLQEPLPNGASYRFDRYLTVGETEVRDSLWTSEAFPGYLGTRTGDETSTVEHIYCDGFDGHACASGGGGDDFIDIHATGSVLSLLDNGSVNVSMPFQFTFYDETSDNLCVNNNGIILFNTSQAECEDQFLNEDGPLWSTYLNDPAIMPLWDDFGPGETAGNPGHGNVYYATQGIAPNRKFIVQWDHMIHTDATTSENTATFEVIFAEAQSGLSFEYLSTTYDPGPDSRDGGTGVGGDTATIGLQARRIGYNEYSFRTSSVADHTGIEWTPTSPHLFTAAATTTVDAGAPVIAVDPAAISASVAAGTSSTVVLSIGNTGNRDLRWTLNQAPAPTAHFPTSSRYAPPPSSVSGNLAAHPRAPVAPGPADARPAITRPLDLLGVAAVPSFAFGITSFDNGRYLSFDANAPADATPLGYQGEALYGGTFIHDDFRKEYALTPFGVLVTIDTVSGLQTVVGRADPGPGYHHLALAWDPLTQTLFASAGYNDGMSALYTVDPATAVYTQIGTITGVSVDGPNGPPINEVPEIAVDPRTGLMYGIEYFTHSLIAIDKTTGAAAIIGNLGISDEPSHSRGLSFDSRSNVLYFITSDQNTTNDGTQSMYIVDTVTGHATFVGAFGTDVGAFAVAVPSSPCATPGNIPWLLFNTGSGTAVAGGSSAVDVTINASSLAAGTYDANICVNSNDPYHRVVDVPVHVDVM